MNKTTMESDVRVILGLYAQGEFDRGLALARQLQRAVPQAAITNYCLGHGLAALQRPAEALAFLRKATQAEPRNAEFMVRYGRALLDVGRIREAETTLQRAYDLNPRMPIGPYTLAVYYASINRFDAALPHFRKVLDAELPAEMRAGVTMDWATALIEVGQVDEASEVLREALKHGQSRAAALASLSQIKAFPLGSEEFLLIEEELAKAGVSGLARSSLLMAKAASFAAIGDYNREFDLILEAKAVRGGTTPLAGLSKLVDDLTTVVTPEVLEGLQARFGTSTFQPIYVVGLPRSGTTLTERILAAHSAVGGAGELQLVNDLARNVMGKHALASVVAAFSSLPAGRLQELLADIEATMRFLCPGVDRIVD
ncbi:MAG: tetratricopeptide repeat protein, partial [Nitrospira sp.]